MVLREFVLMKVVFILVSCNEFYVVIEFFCVIIIDVSCDSLII